MIDNLKFYGASALIGFIISIGWWKSEKERISFPWSLLALTLFWICSASSVISFIKEEGFSFVDAIPLSLDIRYFYRGVGMIESRSSGALAIVSILFFALLFRWLWIAKNSRNDSLLKSQKSRAYQSSSDNADKPRV